MRNVVKKSKVLLVDEDKLFRLKVRRMMEQEEDIEIVGDCISAEETLSQVETLSPNIVLMDTLLPGMNGIEACRRLTGNRYDCDVIILSHDQELINHALLAGASGYYPKDIKQKELATAIRLAYKWQSLKAESDGSVYPIRQIEAMIMEYLAKVGAEQPHDEDEHECLLPEDNGSNTVSEVTLVIPSPGNASQLQRFICRVEETLRASLLETVGSWSNIHITLKLRKPVSLVNVRTKLAMMPEVAEVEEETPVRTGHSTFSKIIKATPRKRLSVTLNRQAEPSTAAEKVTQCLELAKLQPQRVGVTVS